VEEYLMSTTMPRGASWCAAFVHWSFRQCGRILTPAKSYAWSPTWFIKAIALKEGEEPEPGDVFGIYYPKLGRVGHVGIIKEVRQGVIISVEGNTGADGGRDGDGVYTKKRLRGNIRHYSRIR
jgi:hypothetical protein